LFEKITIIGFGLIGSSLARVIKRDQLCKTLVCVDKSEAVCEKVLELNLADIAITSIKDGVKDSDLVVVAVPVGACKDVAVEMRSVLKPGCIVSDVGSVKQAVIDAFKPHIAQNVHFIPGHPIAGTEHSGPEAGFDTLFEGRWFVATPLPDSDVRAVEKVVQLWEACGSRVEIMEPHHHDLILGVTSHLPHLIAYTIVGTATDMEDDVRDEVVKFSASGFRDFTRIAASDPTMWRDIFLYNKDAVLEILQRFSEDLTALQKAIRRGEGDFLYNFFERTRNIRKEVIEAGQADPPAPILDEAFQEPLEGLKTGSDS
jgi:cyclohexadieny/prephenate dehydrogenase